MAAVVALAGPPDALRTGPLALAALEYWRRSSDVRVSLWALAWLRVPTDDVRCTLLSTAVEGVEALRDLADAGHPTVRDRAADALPALLPRISAFVERLP